jgi:hypothetical protein
MDNTTSITDLPPVLLGDKSLDNSKTLRLDEGQIRQLVTGIQDASLKGATRLRSTDIPNDPSTITVCPETIISTPEYSAVIEDTPNAITEGPKGSIIDAIYSMSREVSFKLAIIMGFISISPQIPAISYYIKKYAPWTLTDLGNPSLVGYISYFITFAVIYYILLVLGYNR